MPIQIRQNTFVGSLSNPAPQNPPVSGYSVYPDPLLYSLIFCGYSGRCWYVMTDPLDSTDKASLLGPIAASTHISTALSKVYWRETKTDFLNEAILVLDRVNNLGLFEVNVPTTFKQSFTVQNVPFFTGNTSSYLLGTSSAGLLENRSLTYVEPTIANATTTLGTGWTNISAATTIGNIGLTTQWLITAHVTLISADTHDDVGIRIYNTTDSSYVAGTQTHVEHIGHHLTASVSAVVSITGQKSIALQGISTGGNASAERDHFGAGSNTTKITAIRI